MSDVIYVREQQINAVICASHEVNDVSAPSFISSPMNPLLVYL